jgi:hypothetical protein
MLIVPGLPEEASAADREVARRVAVAVLAIADYLDEIGDEEVRAQVPVLLVQFLCANVAQGAIASGMGVEELRRVRDMLIDGTRAGWTAGIEASMRLLVKGEA